MLETTPGILGLSVRKKNFNFLTFTFYCSKEYVPTYMLVHNDGGGFLYKIKCLPMCICQNKTSWLRRRFLENGYYLLDCECVYFHLQSIVRKRHIQYSSITVVSCFRKNEYYITLQGFPIFCDTIKSWLLLLSSNFSMTFHLIFHESEKTACRLLPPWKLMVFELNTFGGSTLRWRKSWRIAYECFLRLFRMNKFDQYPFLPHLTDILRHHVLSMSFIRTVTRK